MCSIAFDRRLRFSPWLGNCPRSSRRGRISTKSDAARKLVSRKRTTCFLIRNFPEPEAGKSLICDPFKRRLPGAAACFGAPVAVGVFPQICLDGVSDDPNPLRKIFFHLGKPVVKLLQLCEDWLNCPSNIGFDLCKVGGKLLRTSHRAPSRFQV